jgi:predicted DNA binding protein
MQGGPHTDFPHGDRPVSESSDVFLGSTALDDSSPSPYARRLSPCSRQSRAVPDSISRPKLFADAFRAEVCAIRRHRRERDACLPAMTAPFTHRGNRVATDGGTHEEANGTDEPDGRLDVREAVVGILGETVDALVSAGTQAEIERGLCERLIEIGLYRCAWIGHSDRDGRIEATTTVGPATTPIEKLADLYDPLDADRPAQAVIDDAAPTIVRDIPNSDLPEPVREFAAKHGIVSGIGIPIASGEMTNAALIVYTDRTDAFGEFEADVLEQLGRIASIALGAAQTERILLSEPSIELEFRLTGDEVPLATLAVKEGATGQMEWMTQNEAGDVVEYFTIDGTDPETAIAAWEAVDHIHTCRLVDKETKLYEVTLYQSAAGKLLDAGVQIQGIRTDGTAVLVTATAPPATDVRDVLGSICSVYPETQLVAKRTLDDPGEQNPVSRWTDEIELTDRQEDALAAAFDAGYFEWPRDATAEEVAAELDISAATLHYHLRRAESGLVSAFVDAQR